MTSYEIITPTSIGTGVAKTSLGTVNKPSQATQLIEFIPYQASTGAHTAAQSILTEVAIESKSINLLPKRIVLPPIIGGLGTFASVMTPMLEAYECNTPLDPASNQDIEAFGQAQIANTVAPSVGVCLHYGLGKTARPEMFYDKTDNETSSGTTATTVGGGSVTINGGKTLQKLYPHISSGVVTASEDLFASMSFSSNDFANSMPLEVPLQPIAAGLGSAVALALPKGAVYKAVNMGMKDTCTINTTLRLSEALTAAGNFIGTVGYTKQ